MRALLLAFLLLVQDGSLRTKLDDLRARQLPKGAKLGMMVVDLKSGETLYEINAAEAFVPASNTKLWTSAAILATMGKEFAFTTEVYVAGDDVHVVASGDPNISGRFYGGDPTAVFKAWAKKLLDAGVREVKGAVRLHDPYGGDALTHADWKEYNPAEWWAAPVSAFTLNDNCVDVTVKPGSKPGAAAAIEVSPATACVKIVNRVETVETVAKGKEVVWSKKPGTNEITLSGQIGVRTKPPTWSVAVEDPKAFFATVLLETLKGQGIGVAGGAVDDARAMSEVAGARKIAESSCDLVRALQVTNTRSQNLHAELLARRVGYAKSGKGTFASGAKAVSEWAASIGAKATSLSDGSGLSRANRTSPSDVMTLIRYMAKQKDFAVWRDSLAVSGGSEGTLRNRLKDDKTKGRVQAKTGHLEGADCLSGFVRTRSERTLAFSIMVNGHTSTAEARNLIDAIVTQLAEQ